MVKPTSKYSFKPPKKLPKAKLSTSVDEAAANIVVQKNYLVFFPVEMFFANLGRSFCARQPLFPIRLKPLGNIVSILYATMLKMKHYSCKKAQIYNIRKINQMKVFEWNKRMIGWFTDFS